MKEWPSRVYIKFMSKAVISSVLALLVYTVIFAVVLNVVLVLFYGEKQNEILNSLWLSNWFVYYVGSIWAISVITGTYIGSRSKNWLSVSVGAAISLIMVIFAIYINNPSGFYSLHIFMLTVTFPAAIIGGFFARRK